MRVCLTLTENMLGTVSADPELYENFIMSKRPEGVEESVEDLPSVEEEVRQNTTVFLREDGRPYIYDYMVKGFFKSACGYLRRIKEVKEDGVVVQKATLSSKVTAFKKIINGLIFVHPRKLFLDLNGDLEICERPLRAQTPQGERIALARSEVAKAGTKIICEIELLDIKLKPLIIEWLEYGKYGALGQWRNAGHGSFTYEIL